MSSVQKAFTFTDYPSVVTTEVNSLIGSGWHIDVISSSVPHLNVHHITLIVVASKTNVVL